jgi:hypothetical protein
MSERIEETSIESFVEWRRLRGSHLVKVDDVWWEKVKWGVYRIAPEMLRCDYEKVSLPVWHAFAVQAPVCSSHKIQVSSYVRVHLLGEIPDYGIERLPRVSRKAITRALNDYAFGSLDSLTDFPREAYSIYIESVERSNRGFTQGLRRCFDYSMFLENVGVMERSLELRWEAAWNARGRLVGLLGGYAIRGTAYAYDIFVANEAARSGVGRALYHNFALACKANGRISEVYSGPDWYERPQIQWFKESVGHTLSEVPVRFYARPGVEQLMRRVLGRKFNRFKIDARC